MHSAGCPVQQRGEVAGHRACSLNRNSSGFTAVPPQNVLALPPVLGAAIALWRVYRTVRGPKITILMLLRVTSLQHRIGTVGVPPEHQKVVAFVPFLSKCWY